MPETENTEPENTDDSGKKRKRGPKTREIFRVNSDLTDGKLAETSRVKRQFFIDDEVAFKTFDSSFGGTFSADWLAAIEAFEAMSTYENLLDEQQQCRLDADEADKKFTDALLPLNYYLPLAFTAQEGIRDEYGLNKILTAEYKRGNKRLVLGFAILDALNPIMPQLIAAGLSATWWTDTDVLLNDFAENEVKYEKQKLLTTQGVYKRIRQYNELYKISSRVAKAAEVIFHGNKVKIDLYR